MVPSVTINHPSLSQCQPDWFSQLQSPLWGSWKYPMLYTRVIRPSNGKSPTSHALMSLMFLFNISVRIAERKVYYHSDWHWLTTYGLYPSIIHIYYIYVYIPTVSIYIPTAWFKPCCFYRCPPPSTPTPTPRQCPRSRGGGGVVAAPRRRRVSAGCCLHPLGWSRPVDFMGISWDNEIPSGYVKIAIENGHRK